MFENLAGQKSSIRKEILSGLTVALALVPEAVAFAFVAGVHPLVGLYAAFMVGLITATIGGRPGMISGATGALAVVMVGLVSNHGVEYLFATVVLMGVFQILAGVLRLGKFIRLVPHPAMLGFVNGLAIVIFLAQLNQFKVRNAAGELEWMGGGRLALMLGLVAATMAIIHFLPRLTTAIPSSLAAILAVSGLVIGLKLDTPSVGDLASIAGGLPSFHLPMVPITFQTLTIIVPYALILATIGLIESLLTLSLIDQLTETRGRASKECIGQGIANTVTGLFGGMGGCAMIGQSMINVNSGGRRRLSGIVAASLLLVFIVAGASLIEAIPLAALVGVMFMVVYGTFEWSSFRIMRNIPRSDAFVLVLVSGVTVITDLAIAVAVGVVVSALVFAWESAKNIWIDTVIEDGATVHKIHGPVFFGSVTRFRELFDPTTDPDDVVIDFRHSRVWDHSAIEAIDQLCERYKNAGRSVHLRRLSPDCRDLFEKAGNMVEVSVHKDPKYGVIMDYSPRF